MPKLLLPLAAVGLGAAGTTAVFQSREKKKAQERVEQFQSSEKKDWDRFTDNTARKSFVKQLGADPMTDPKLLQYADSMNRLKTGKRIADIPGDGGKSYQITKLRGSERLGCTCNDWRYKKSVAQPGEAQDCKHIQQFKEMSKTGSVLPSFLDMDKHEGFIDPRSDDFNKNRAFGLGLGAALPGAAFGALYSGAVKDMSPSKSVALTAAGGLATGVPVGLLALKDFRELQAEGKNPVTRKAHDIAKIKKSQEWARKRYHQMNKTAAARFQDNLPNPVIDGKPHDGTWTIVGSGRLSIPKKTSDIDYMVPLEEIGDLSSFNEYKDVPGAYWKDLDPVKGRPATVVAVPRYAYDKIDASYQQAVDRFGKRKLRQLKKTLPKDSFYKDIGVVYTSDAMKKEAAEVISDLKPHQERVLRKIENSDGVIVAHRVGAGKTLTSIAAAVNSGLPIEVVTPASLTPNYEKELKKHVRGNVTARIRSYEMAAKSARKGDGIDTSRFLVVDEAHRLRNAGTQTSSLLRDDAAKAKKRLLLTGTALYNQPSDISPLVNIAAGRPVLPADPSVFDSKFIQETEVDPNLIDRMAGVQPGIKKSLRNHDVLVSALAGKIDLFDEASLEDFPEQVEERIRVPMSKSQHAVYETVMDAAPLHVRLKIKSGLPPSKQEAKDLNAFVAGGRQASLSPRPYVQSMTDEDERASTPKIQEAVSRLSSMSKSDPNFRGVVYSNYVEAGLRPYEKSLKREGIKFETLTGSLSAKQKAQLVENYNSGKTPVLLVSSSGTEGLDLKGTKLVQVLEPHWNNSKIDQVIGRGVRYQSHKHLPPEERKVVVQRYYSTIPQGRISSLLGLHPGKSTEEWIQDRADEKSELARQMREVFQRASLIETKKEAGHVEDRIAERAPKEGSAPQYDRNVYVTGHSGAGKSTLAKQLAEERGLPIFELDKTPEIRDFLEQQKKHFRATGSLGLEQTRERERAALRQALSKIKDPHIVEGSYFLSNTDLLPNESEVYLVDRPVDVILKQRVERTVAKDIERGRQPDPERPRRLGIELIQHYHPGVEELRKRPGVKTFGQLKKLAGHVEDRIAERAPGAEPEVHTLRAKLRNMKLRKGQTYHIPLKRGRGYAVVGDVGDRHVVKTVLGPSMRPPGERLKVARAPRDYRKEYDEYHAKPEQVENRSLRNQARRRLGLRKGDPREADHKTPLSRGGGNGHGNLRAVSRKTNRTKFTDPA